MTVQDKIDELSQLAKETIGASFMITHNEGGMFKIVFNRKVGLCVQSTKGQKLYSARDFDKMVSEAIDYIKTKRRPSDYDTLTKKPFTLHKF